MTYVVSLGGGPPNRPMSRTAADAREFAEILERHSLEGHLDGWWSPHALPQRRAAPLQWRPASAVVLTLNAEGHARLGQELGRRALAALADVATLAFASSYGLCAVLLVRDPIDDAELFHHATCGAERLAREALRRADVHGLEINARRSKDRTDFAQMYAEPGEGVLLLRQEVWDATELAGLDVQDDPDVPPPQDRIVVEALADCLDREAMYADLPRLSGDLESDVDALLKRLGELTPRVRRIGGEVPPVVLSAGELLLEEEDGLTDLRAAIEHAKVEGWLTERVLDRDPRFRVVALTEAGRRAARRAGDREAFTKVAGPAGSPGSSR